MASSHDTIPSETARRLVSSVERLLASLGATASASFREVCSAETLRLQPGPLALLSCRFSKGAAGPAALVFPGTTALRVARILLGETPESAPQTPGPEDEDALRELANQAASGLATALGEVLGKSVSFEAPAVEWVTEGGSGLPAWADTVSLGMDLSVGGEATQGILVVPRAAVAPAPVKPIEAALPPLNETPTRKNGNGMDLLLDISLPVTVELGRTRMMIRDILHLAPGSVLELDKLAGEPVDILVNEKSIARGEVVVIDEAFGVRLTSIVTPSERVASLR
jgi:flagellar motor switch protein FliN/FliY